MSPARKILVVDDDPSLNRLMVRILTGAGYAVLSARDGAEGLALISADRDSEVGLIVTDLIMPVMGGEKLAQSVRESRPEMKILFISGDVGVLPESAYPGGPENQTLRKPFTPGELTNKVKGIFGGPGA